MIFEKIQNDIKDAMKAKDNLKRDCLRNVVSEVKNLTVNAGKPITDDVCLKVIQKSVKTHNDSIAQFGQAGRDDLVKNEKAELAVLKAYLPEMFSESRIQTIILKIVVDNKIEEVKKNIGQVMKLLAQHPDKAKIDMKIASQYLSVLMK